ncbi:hypothetical protein C8Q72DRAFT_798513 [Fomitopsis betulina]|nr:hypothetical protein C8Q72DRAFT_798513 [Fomitopsis betulina]
MAHVNPVEVPTQQGCALDARMVVCATTPFVVAWAMDRDSARCVFELYTYDRNIRHPSQCKDEGVNWPRDGRRPKGYNDVDVGDAAIVPVLLHPSATVHISSGSEGGEQCTIRIPTVSAGHLFLDRVGGTVSRKHGSRRRVNADLRRILPGTTLLAALVLAILAPRAPPL